MSRPMYTSGRDAYELAILAVGYAADQAGMRAVPGYGYPDSAGILLVRESESATTVRAFMAALNAGAWAYECWVTLTTVGTHEVVFDDRVDDFCGDGWLDNDVHYSIVASLQADLAYWDRDYGPESENA